MGTPIHLAHLSEHRLDALVVAIASALHVAHGFLAAGKGSVHLVLLFSKNSLPAKRGKESA
jgi:hypothetical protein